MSEASRTELRRQVVAALLITLVAAVILRAMGRVIWCACGSLVPWSWDVWSLHNSQHLLDPYTFTHVLHGIAYYGILWLLLRNRLSVANRGVGAIAIEATWEVVENTEMVIRHYREATLSLDYFGDSVLNSVADIAACAVGYAVAAWAPVWASVAGFFAVELILVWWIKDSLLLNILMLLHPIEAVKEWQMSGMPPG